MGLGFSYISALVLFAALGGLELSLCQSAANDALLEAFQNAAIADLNTCTLNTCNIGQDYVWDLISLQFANFNPDNFPVEADSPSSCCTHCAEEDPLCILWDYNPETLACRKFLFSDYVDNFAVLQGNPDYTGNPQPVKKEPGSYLGFVMQKHFRGYRAFGTADYVIVMHGVTLDTCDSRTSGGDTCLAQSCAATCASNPGCKFWDVDSDYLECRHYRAESVIFPVFVVHGPTRTAGVSFGPGLGFAVPYIDYLWGELYNSTVDVYNTTLSWVASPLDDTASQVVGYMWDFNVTLPYPMFIDSAMGQERGVVYSNTTREEQMTAPDFLATSPIFPAITEFPMGLQGFTRVYQQPMSVDAGLPAIPLPTPLNDLPPSGFYPVDYILQASDFSMPINIHVDYFLGDLTSDPLDNTLPITDILARAGICGVAPSVVETLAVNGTFSDVIFANMSFTGMPLAVLNVGVGNGDTGSCHPMANQELVGKNLSLPVTTGSWQECCDECSQTTGCVGWSYRTQTIAVCNEISCVAGRCLLMSSVDSVMEDNTGVFSGQIMLQETSNELEQFPGVELLSSEVIVSTSTTPGFCWQQCTQEDNCSGYTFYANGTCALLSGGVTGSRQVVEATSGLNRNVRSTRAVEQGACVPTAVLVSSNATLVDVLPLSTSANGSLSWQELCCFNNLDNCSSTVTSNGTIPAALLLPCPAQASKTCAAVQDVESACDLMPGITLQAPVSAQLNNGLRTYVDNPSECCSLCSITPNCIAFTHQAADSDAGFCWLLSSFTGTTMAGSSGTTSGINSIAWKGTCSYSPTHTLEEGQSVIGDLPSSVTDHVSWETVCCANPGITDCRKDVDSDYTLFIPCTNGVDSCEGTVEHHNYTVPIAVSTAVVVAILTALLGCCIAALVMRRKHRKEVRGLNYEEAAFLIASSDDSSSSKMSSLMGEKTKGFKATKCKWSSERWKGSNSVVVLGMNPLDKKEVVAKTFKDQEKYLHEKELHNLGYAAGRVPEVYDVFDGDNITPPCIVMEAGSYNLASMLDRGIQQSSLHQRATMRNLCDAVASLHSHAIAHLAINPTNIMWFDAAHKWKLLHLGNWAHARTPAVVDGLDIRYCSPEVARALAADGVFNCRLPADMWSLGVIAWELYMGKKLFGSDLSDEDVKEMLIGDRLLPFESNPKLWNQIDDEPLREIIEHLLVRIPTERWTMERVLDHPLFKTQHDEVMKAARLGGVTERLNILANELAQLEEVSLDSLRQSATNGLLMSIEFEKLTPVEGDTDHDAKSVKTVSMSMKSMDFYDPIDELEHLQGMLEKLLDQDGVNAYCDYFLGKYNIEEAPVNLIGTLAESEEPEVLIQANCKYAVKFQAQYGCETAVEIPIEGITFLVVMDEDGPAEGEEGIAAGVPVVPLGDEVTSTTWNGFAVWETANLKPGRCKLQFMAALKLKGGEEVKVRKVMGLDIREKSSELYLHKAASQVQKMWDDAPEWMKLSVHGVNMLFSMQDMLSAAM